jgi:selenocysteine-specific elongation factor
MVAGATGIDCVLLVVAADAGVMPQTREHLAICELLGVRRGVIVITKCDVAAADLIELAEEDIRDATRGSFLESAELVRCSAKTGSGLVAVAEAVVRASPTSTSRRGPAFVAVDRVFAKPGAGPI